jgi:hypothetical protein
MPLIDSDLDILQRLSKGEGIRLKLPDLLQRFDDVISVSKSKKLVVIARTDVARKHRYSHVCVYIDRLCVCLCIV